jgi:hypothetical protein
MAEFIGAEDEQKVLVKKRRQLRRKSVAREFPQSRSAVRSRVVSMSRTGPAVMGIRVCAWPVTAPIIWVGSVQVSRRGDAS